MAEQDSERIKEAVRERYGAHAREKLNAPEAAATECSDTSCCGDAEGSQVNVELLDQLYSRDEIKDLPADTLMSLGCGNPTAIAELQQGERVLDLGSGGGLDCFLAARKVGPEGKAVGLDMTADMVELARRNAEKVGLSNVEFHLGEMENMPFEDGSFDVVISNCVINLSPDKDAVFRESYRVLRPGGRFRVSDLVWLAEPSAEKERDLERWAACAAGALLPADFERRLRDAGFRDVAVNVQGRYGDSEFASAMIEARKSSAREQRSRDEERTTVGVSADGGDSAPRTKCC